MRRIGLESFQRLAGGLKRRLTGMPILQRGVVEWEHLRFEFVAEPRVFMRARDRGFENGLCRLVMTVCGDGGIAVDIGMNYGFVTTVMAHAVGAEGHVHSFEPVPSFNNAVAQTLIANSLRNVTLHRKAAGAAPGTLNIRLSRFDRPFDVPIVRLDDELKDIDRLDMIKIDVDGPDLEVLRGARKLIKRYNPVVVIELNNRADEIHRLLQSLGYRYFIDTENWPAQPGNWPGNLVASVDEVKVPARGELTTSTPN